MINENSSLIFAILGGVVPAMFWLWFWIREDRLKPEPKSALFSAFVGGVIAVLLALFFELVLYFLLVDANPINLTGPEIFKDTLQNLAERYQLLASQNIYWDKVQGFFNQFDFSAIYNFDVKRCFLIIAIAPIVEEILKLFLSYHICLRRKINDEPIDAAIYLLTTSLGFAALETIFYILPAGNGSILDIFMAGNLRSIGPMLIHLVSSAMIGLFIGLAFYKSKMHKFLYAMLGLIVAIILHATFNFLVVLGDITHHPHFFLFGCLLTWILMLILLIFFNRVKKVVRES
jgi:RsiW-degrading membrane proteinase PrsW (M82 family)